MNQTPQYQAVTSFSLTTAHSLTALAGTAGATARDHDGVKDLNPTPRRADVDDGAVRFVSESEPRGAFGDVTASKVGVRGADGGPFDADRDVGVVEENGDGYLEPDARALSLQDQSLHESSLIS
ncbi:MAG TPA: hypothetical protein PLG60_07080 [Acidimicrobiales bacterium]|nr:hypothetical protein [Acidimicrobiales bacterium]